MSQCGHFVKKMILLLLQIIPWFLRSPTQSLVTIQPQLSQQCHSFESSISSSSSIGLGIADIHTFHNNQIKLPRNHFHNTKNNSHAKSYVPQTFNTNFSTYMTLPQPNKNIRMMHKNEKQCRRAEVWTEDNYDLEKPDVHKTVLNTWLKAGELFPKLLDLW